MYGALVTMSLKKSLIRDSEIAAGKELVAYMKRMERERLLLESLELCTLDQYRRALLQR